MPPQRRHGVSRRGRRNAGQRQPIAAPSPTHLAGQIMWLSPKNEITVDTPGFEDGCYDHPVIILSPGTLDGNVTILIMTSLGNQDLLKKFPENSHLRKKYLPIWPARRHPDLDVLLMLNNNKKLRKKSYIKTERQQPISLVALRPYERENPIKYILTSECYHYLIKHAGFHPPVPSPANTGIDGHDDTILAPNHEPRETSPAPESRSLPNEFDDGSKDLVQRCAARLAAQNNEQTINPPASHPQFQPGSRYGTINQFHASSIETETARRAATAATPVAAPTASHTPHPVPHIINTTRGYYNTNSWSSRFEQERAQTHSTYTLPQPNSSTSLLPRWQDEDTSQNRRRQHDYYRRPDASGSSAGRVILLALLVVGLVGGISFGLWETWVHRANVLHGLVKATCWVGVNLFEVVKVIAKYGWRILVWFLRGTFGVVKGVFGCVRRLLKGAVSK